MEIKREPLGGPGAQRTSASRQLLARDMLRGDLEDEALERYVEQRRDDHDAGEGGRLGRRATRSTR